MAQGLKIGKIFGADIELHWSFLFLMVFTLILSYPTFYLFVLIALLFVCVFVHELSHTISSRRNGVKVKKIVLLPLGGASIIDEANLTPEVELRIAAAGPVMSIFLGCLFGVLVTVSPPGGLTQILQFLFEINLLLGVFNLLPAFPTDGGRVFRSYLERRYDEYKATLLTIRVSKYVMALFIVGTFAYTVAITAPLYYKEFTFLFDLLIVFFLYGGAVSERELAEIKKMSEGVDVSEAMSTHFEFVASSTKVSALYGIVKKSKEHLMITKIGKEYAYVNLARKDKLKETDSVADLAQLMPSIKEKENIVRALRRWRRRNPP